MLYYLNCRYTSSCIIIYYIGEFYDIVKNQSLSYSLCIGIGTLVHISLHTTLSLSYGHVSDLRLENVLHYFVVHVEPRTDSGGLKRVTLRVVTEDLIDVIVWPNCIYSCKHGWLPVVGEEIGSTHKCRDALNVYFCIENLFVWRFE